MSITVDPNKRAGLSRAARRGYAPQIAPEIVEAIMHADARASHRAMAQVIYVQAMTRPEGTPFPTREGLADLLGVSTYIVRKALKVLRAVGLYIWERVAQPNGQWNTRAVHLARPAEGVTEIVEALKPPPGWVDNPPESVDNPVSAGHTEGSSPTGRRPAIIPNSSKRVRERGLPRLTATRAEQRAARAADQQARLRSLLGLPGPFAYADDDE